MSLKIGIIGLPNVGKSTLFNALLKKRVAFAANYPFATIEPNVGVVGVPDERLSKLAQLVKLEEQMEKEPPIVPAVVEFVDIAGLVKGAHEGAGLGNQFLAHIREVDAIIHILRDFSDPNIVREGSTDPDSDREVVNMELALADLQTIEKLISAQEKEVRTGRDSTETKKLEILRKINRSIEAGGNRPFDYFGSARHKFAQGLSDERIRAWFEKLPLITLKPVIYVFNVSEEDYAKRLEEERLDPNTMIISAKLEQDLADYSEEEKKEYLRTMGIEETGLERLIRKAYGLLELISFLTAGEKEVRAWTIRRGQTALEASGVIHTDFMKSFIKAEVISYEDFVKIGGWKKAREQGKTKFEGKDYLMKDGNVVEFKIGK